MHESYLPADRSLPLADSTIAGILRDACRRCPGAVALVFGDPRHANRRRRTYAEVAAEAEAVARALADRYGPGDRVAVFAPTLPEFFVLSFAAAMARLVLVPVNPALRAQEVMHILSRSAAVAVFHAGSYRGNDLGGTVEGLQRSLPGLRDVVDFGTWAHLVSEGESASATRRPLPPPEPHDLAQIVFTSGTTGTPKGAMLTHHAMCNAARLGGERFGLGPGDVYVDTIPLFHVGGQGTAFQIVQASATNVLLPYFDPGLHLELLESERATHTIGVPTMLLGVIDHPDFTRRDLSSLRSISTGGSSVPAEMVRHLEASLGVRSTVVFGQTESCGYISQTSLDDEPEDKASTVGTLLPHLEGRVVDPDTHRVLGRGEVGELQIRGYSVMLGYFEEPDASCDALAADGWLRTGDLATMDARGYLRITGRLKDMIVTGGINVFPVEIETVIAAHPSCALVAVIGVPDARWGEAVVAVVQPVAGTAPNAGELQAFTRERLAPYKVPKRWVFADELPMTASGKVQKFLLRERMAHAPG